MAASEQPGTAVEILEFDPGLAASFRDLNVEWLRQYFEVEPLDEQILEDPRKAIIDPGGAILFARDGARIVGTVALRRHADGVFELTKMAVTAGVRGRGIGRQLMVAALHRFGQAGGRRLYLESHSSLQPALALYESVGFVQEAPPGASEYSRCNVYMVYRGEVPAGPDSP